MKRYLLLLLLLTSCSPLLDPCEDDSAACRPEDVWAGPVLPVRATDVLPDFVDDPCPHPYTIQELIDMALRNNPITALTWANARAAAFNWDASQSALYPTIIWQSSIVFNVNKLNGSAAVSNTAGTGGNVISTSNLIPSGTSATTTTPSYSQHVVHNLSINFLLADFGGRNATIDAARNALFVSDWTHNRSLQDVIFTLLSAYYNYEQALGLYEAARLDLIDTKATLDSAEAQYQAGVKTHVDVLQAKSSYVNAELALNQAWGSAKSYLAAIAAAVGLTADSQFEVVPLPGKLPIDEVKQDLEQLVELAKDARPDLAAAYANYREAIANLNVARSNGKPTLSANIDYEWVNNVHFPSQNSSFRSGALVLDVPIFSGFLYYNQERQAAALVDAAYANLQVTESNVLLNVVQSYYAFETAITTVKYSEEFLQYAQESFHATQLGYKMGINSITDLTTNQTTLANARAQLVQARTQWLTALANIAYSTGVLGCCSNP